MSFTEELTQLVMIIVGLLVVLFGVNFWTQKGGSLTLPSMGNKSSDATGPTNIGNGTAESMAGMEAEEVESESIPKMGPDRHADRFDLTGKNAEAAAKVLKGMLKKDEQFKNQSE